jgi:hypothetical protein
MTAVPPEPTFAALRAVERLHVERGELRPLGLRVVVRREDAA